MAKSESDLPSLPDLNLLHRRHRGLTECVCKSYAQAARVCLDGHHRSPQVLEVKNKESHKQFSLRWTRSIGKTKDAWANKDDATRDGAYAMCIASLEIAEKLLAVKRAETRTGADYYVDRAPTTKDFEATFRLEVSGLNHASRSAIAQRLKQKVAQALDGDSDLPAYAAVVGFRELLVMYVAVEK